MAIIRAAEDIEAGLQALLRLDPALAAVAAMAGPLPLRLSEPGFAGLAHIVVSQMVSRASAGAIWRRMCAAGPVRAADYAALDAETVRAFGLSRAKAETLRRVAAEIAAGRLDLHALCLAGGADAMARLTAVPGIGPWTAEVYLMFCGGHADIFPAGDVALQSAFAHAFSLAERPKARALAGHAARWSPWRAVAARLFWAYYATRMGRDATPAI